MSERPLHLAQRPADGGGALHHRFQAQPAGSEALHSGIMSVMRSTTSMMLAFGWRFMISSHGGLAVGRAVVAHVLHAVLDHAEVAQADGAPLRQATIDRDVLGGGLRLVVGVDLPARVSSSTKPFGRLALVGGDRRAHLLEADAAACSARVG